MGKETISCNEKYIITNSVLVGDYGYNKNNLPHEMINFFKADDGNFYVYITPYGVLDKDLKMKNIRAILFVRNVGDGLIEVVAKAECSDRQTDEDFYTQGIELYGENNKAGKAPWSIKKGKYKYQKKAKYGRVEISKIHSTNQRDNEIHVSLKVDSICLPKKTFFLTNNPDSCRPGIENVFLIKEPAPEKKTKGEEKFQESKGNKYKQIANQSMKAYYKEDGQGYKKLEEIIENSDLWRAKEETPTYNDYIQNPDNRKGMNCGDNFLSISLQQDNEVIFTNLFYYFFQKYPQLINKLFNVDGTGWTVEREKQKMDIRIYNDNKFIIIENKIKSDINGTKEKKRMKTIPEGIEFNDEGYQIEEYNGQKLIYSQLSDYFKKAQEKNDKDEKDREIRCFIIAPSYSTISTDKQAYAYGDEYKVIDYKDIKEKFLEFSKTLKLKDYYLEEFIKALEKHCGLVDNEHRNILMSRLEQRVKEFNRNKDSI